MQEVNYVNVDTIFESIFSYEIVLETSALDYVKSKKHDEVLMKIIELWIARMEKISGEEAFLCDARADTLANMLTQCLEG